MRSELGVDQQDKPRANSSRGSVLLYTTLLFGAFIALAKWPWLNPVSHFSEAGPPAYFQAHRVVEHGSKSDVATIRAVMSNGYISMVEYQDVWDAFMRVPVGSDGSLNDQLDVDASRSRLAAALNDSH